jgi:hypothetical protein
VNAQELCLKLVQDLQGATSKDVVNNVRTADSDVEHEIDVDVTIDGYVFNMTVNINRFCKA